MTELENPWLPEHYREHIFGLGLISLNYNLFEATLQYILWHYTSISTARFLFDNRSNEDRCAAIRAFANEREKDPDILGHIDHLLTYFSICNENRNILMHSRQAFGRKPLGPEYLSVEKRLKSGEPGIFHLKLGSIRRVSNNIVAGVIYCVGIDDYLAFREGKYLRLMDLGKLDVPAPALPNKPPLPRKLDPHQPVVNLQDDPTPPEPSQAK